jgi:hypothetical protein
MNFARLLPLSRVLPDISLIRPGNGRKAESAPGGAGWERREDFVYQESSWLIHLHRTQGAIHDCHCVGHRPPGR